jgi:hypothetical protein
LSILDPTKSGVQHATPQMVFGADALMIKQCDVFVVYLSDDISVGGSQEILIAKYFKKPVIALAPLGGKFNGSKREHFGRVVKNYQDPFVFSTCDVVCNDVEAVAKALVGYKSIVPKSISIIDDNIALV